MINSKTLLLVLIPLILLSGGALYIYRNFINVPWAEPSGKFSIGIM